MLLELCPHVQEEAGMGGGGVHTPPCSPILGQGLRWHPQSVLEPLRGTPGVHLQQ